MTCRPVRHSDGLQITKPTKPLMGKGGSSIGRRSQERFTVPSSCP